MTPDNSPSRLMSEVARCIRELRRQYALSARELSERCVAAGAPSLTRSTIAKIESGVRRFVTLDEAAALAQALGVAPHELLRSAVGAVAASAREDGYGSSGETLADTPAAIWPGIDDAQGGIADITSAVGLTSAATQGTTSDSSRSWEALKRLTPAQLMAQAPVHLVCLIEACGDDDLLQQRTYWTEELISQAEAGGRSLRVSVVAYGPHGIAWRIEDRPPEIRAWATSGDVAIKALRGLVGREADKREYARAAQLECALKLARERLVGADGRPVIVTMGGRQAHPPGLDTSGRLIPCPKRVDLASELGRVSSLPGTTFGAIHDPECGGGIWRQLGRHAVATADAAVDVESFASGLGLLATAQAAPFTAIEP